MADEEVKKGDKIQVIYTGYLEDGSVFDSNEGKDALSFEVGAGQVIKGFDDAVVGMKVGENKSITIKPEEAYGERHEEMVIKIPKNQFQGEEVKEGMMVSSNTGMQATVVAVNENDVTLDFNFPLAGKTLKFDIKIAAIN
ncbi:MAG: peptidylprolyl isomerase [Candidatus Parvarchaeota archaeon]|nr:peptidylprolyl isomerase [Candidatus Parvarchaeota archaeon]MCW1294369.1 peptidylprolyl isomerase [Candidatus Parvarchaeum tengchongense]MCW1295260.1 peptidylprolyl isomerase [Candidatus Parvarchaeum tengchongense]MCW1299411.1 peptidylprolyl isomerase [Candidatus Parvarchaeum tengchongense]MCW1311937.1 peptidylprolyl isomerase [Candidatus Parvarchaeum tengchongense]